ncbi:MAG: hypothetical protein J6K86_03135 [Clostridia bacterium]|nr:hypothetical protein [Clostridia bacterium]
MPQRNRRLQFTSEGQFTTGNVNSRRATSIHDGQPSIHANAVGNSRVK